MPVAAHIPVEEYLHTAYRPDCDYVDGEIVDRNVGDRIHSECQGLIYTHLRKLGEGLQLFAFVEWRVQVSRERFRIPDVCVVVGPKPTEKILMHPPFIVVEVLSPDDRMSSMQQRIDDYLHFGVPHIWIVDPNQKRAWVCTHEGSFEAKDLTLKTESPDLTLPLREIFQGMD